MSHSALVDEWIATNGAPPKFEPGASASFDSHASYLATFGIQLRRMGWRMQLSQNSGPWRNVSLACEHVSGDRRPRADPGGAPMMKFVRDNRDLVIPIVIAVLLSLLMAAPFAAAIWLAG